MKAPPGTRCSQSRAEPRAAAARPPSSWVLSGGVLSIGVGLERIRELLPAYEKCDGFGCVITPTGIHHDDDCSEKEQATS